MKRVLFLLLAFVLWLPVQLRAQDAEALAALVGVLKEVDDPAFHLDILKLKMSAGMTYPLPAPELTHDFN